MKIKEEYEVETGTRKRWFNYYTCDSCGVEFRKQKRLAEGAPREHYCSLLCYNKDRISPDRVSLTCAHCSTTFTRAKSKLQSSKSGLYFCTRACKDTAQSYMPEIQPDHYGSGVGEYRARALKAYGYVCNRCGYSENNAALVVHHKDHNRSNDNINNLEVLCANCHAIHHWS